MKKGVYGTLLQYLALSLLAILFLLVFSYNTSPLTAAYGSDSAFFQLVGRGMTHGLLPYRDFFDMKGPYLFLIEYVGQLLCYGRGGCFVMQTISLSLTMVFADKCFQLCLGRRRFGLRLLLLIPCAFVAACTLNGGNLTEEYSLPFLVASLYLCLSYFQHAEKTGAYAHEPMQAALYGLFFGILAFLRITNAAFIGAVILTISILLLMNREYKNLFINAACFLAGSLAAALPVCAFFAAKGLFGVMLDAVFGSGFLYTKSGLPAAKTVTFISRFITNGLFLPALIPALVCIIGRVRDIKHWLLSITGFFTLLAAAYLGRGYLHYMMLALPVVVYGMWLLSLQIAAAAGDRQLNGMRAAKRRIRVAALTILVVMATQLQPFMTVLNYSADAITGRQSALNADAQITDIVERIPREEHDSIYAFGLTALWSRWYCVADVFPCMRICDYQNVWFGSDPAFEQELMQAFDGAPPKWLVRPVDNAPDFLDPVVAEKYTERYRNDAYVLYRLRTEAYA